jgi:hypothetical protein
VCDLKNRVENILPEFLTNALLEHVARVSITHAVFDHVVKNSGNNGVIVAPVPREDYRNVRGMREVGKLRAFPDLPVMMLRGKRKCMIDRI